jgi:hypothetical protein
LPQLQWLKSVELCKKGTNTPQQKVEERFTSYVELLNFEVILQFALGTLNPTCFRMNIHGQKKGQTYYDS